LEIIAALFLVLSEAFYVVTVILRSWPLTGLHAINSSVKERGGKGREEERDIRCATRRIKGYRRQSLTAPLVAPGSHVPMVIAPLAGVTARALIPKRNKGEGEGGD
jgi:hypothetical protein